MYENIFSTFPTKLTHLLRHFQPFRHRAFTFRQQCVQLPDDASAFPEYVQFRNLRVLLAVLQILFHEQANVEGTTVHVRLLIQTAQRHTFDPNGALKYRMRKMVNRSYFNFQVFLVNLKYIKIWPKAKKLAKKSNSIQLDSKLFNHSMLNNQFFCIIILVPFSYFQFIKIMIKNHLKEKICM